ncbi:phage repressor [Legionella santicrucis]|uniref:Phage repressor n=1 Tax=Legionella santicrucis TaxID=45074 RepID=A0A0W0Y9Y3_9GAMM|nr:S24 family peptidase [Legionella santicrucis]KTD53474.1 phage repressor [Legionella santicrucis]
MDLKTEIGNRITQSRKALGITIKELAARTGTLSAARISNWEQCTRSPGPLEAKLLADQLNVSASYLLCLTDNPHGELHTNRKGARQIPVLSIKEAIHAQEIITGGANPDAEQRITVDEFNKSLASTDLFAVMIEDNSMQPDFLEGNIVVVNSDLSPKPGDVVLVYLVEKKQTVLRKYRETQDCLYQLLASNELWAMYEVKDVKDAKILGIVVEHRRYF